MSSKVSKNQAPQPLPYADEVLCANWNPLAMVQAEPPARVQKSVLDDTDAESFLARLYSCQRA